MGARPENAPDQRDWKADDRDGAADLRDVAAEERDRLAKGRDRDTASHDGLLRSEIRVIRRLLWDAEARESLLEERVSSDGAGTGSDGSEQAAVDLAVVWADRRMTAQQIRDCLGRMDESVGLAEGERRLTGRDREAAFDDRRSAAGDRFASLGDRHQAAIERVQLPYSGS